MSQLLGMGIVIETAGASTGGRPARALRLGADAGHILAASVEATHVDAAVTSLDGRILAHCREPHDLATGVNHLVDRLEALFGSLSAEIGRFPGPLWGFGLGVPGPVEFRTGRPLDVWAMPGWDRYPVRERLAARYGAPVWLDGDVNLLAIAECRSGAVATHQNIIVIKLDRGIGAAVISNGRLHRGADGTAGSIGHTGAVRDGAAAYPRGNLDCLDAVAGGRAIEQAATRAAKAGRSDSLRRDFERKGSVTAADVARAATHGDAVAVNLLMAAGRQVGSVLAGMVNFFNPSLIVVAGDLAFQTDLFPAAIRETVYRRSSPAATRDLVIQRTRIDRHAGLIGASALVEEQIFARPHLPDPSRRRGCSSNGSVVDQ